MPFRTHIPPILVALLPFAHSAWGAAPKKSEYKIPYQELKKAAQDYLDAACPPKRLRYMTRWLTQSVEQKILDNRHLQDDSAMRAIMLDWAADNQKKIRRKDPKAIFQACYFFIIFTDKGFIMPWQFRNELNEETCAEILKFLREETAKAKSAPASDKKKDASKK